VEKRKEFVRENRRGWCSVTDMAERHGIAWKTG